jgi:hypothetical protein
MSGIERIAVERERQKSIGGSREAMAVSEARDARPRILADAGASVVALARL